MIGFLILGIVAIIVWWGNAAVMICGVLIVLLALWAIEERSYRRNWERHYQREHALRCRADSRDRDRGAA